MDFPVNPFSSSRLVLNNNGHVVPLKYELISLMKQCHIIGEKHYKIPIALEHFDRMGLTLSSILPKMARYVQSCSVCIIKRLQKKTVKL